MRSFYFAFLSMLVLANVAQAQTEGQIQRTLTSFTANSSSTDSNYYVLDFNNAIFEHDDVSSCKEIKTASRLVKEVCDSYGVAAAEFTRYSIVVHTAKLIGEQALQNILSTIRQDKNIDLQPMQPSNVEVPLVPMPPIGCMSFDGFSVVTGQSCTPPPTVQTWTSYPSGCTSRDGYSVTTGLPCTPRLFPTKQ